MSGMRLLPLGVGDAFSARHYSACFALEADGRWLLVDCPHPLRKMLHEASTSLASPLDLDRIEAVVLTHLHSDHVSGLSGVGFYFRFVLQRRLPLLVHPEVAADLWERTLAGGMEWSLQKVGEPPAHRTCDDFFDVRFLKENEPATFGPFRLHARKTIHNIPTTALRVEAGGRTLGYSADTAFDPTLIDWLASADLIVHEASGGFLHTPVEALAALPAELRRKLRLIHYPDDFDATRCDPAALRPGEIVTI